MIFQYGFEYKNIKFGWCKKVLYRLPFEKNLRWFPLKKLSEIKIGNCTGYRCYRDKISMAQLKFMTKKIEWEVEIIVAEDCPF